MTDLPFTDFWARRASSEYNETVVKLALEQLKDSPETNRTLASAINENVKFQGFNKNSSIAPVPLLTEHVVAGLRSSNDLAAAVFEAWAKSQRRLHDAVAERLAISGIPVDYPDFAGGGFRGTWNADDWRRERDAIRELHGEFASDDVLLMLCYVTGLMPLDTGKPTNGETAPEEPNMLNPADISQWKRTLDSLAADSPMWEGEIPDFIEWLSDLAGKKGIAIRWREIISELSAPGPIAEQLNSVGVSAVAWAAAEFDSSENASKALTTAVELKNVVEDLVEYLAGSPNLGQVREFDERIKTLRAELDAILASPRPPNDEPPKPKTEPSGDVSAPPDISDEAPRQDAVVANESAENDNAASASSDRDERGKNEGDSSKTEFGDKESDSSNDDTLAASIVDSSDGAGDGSEIIVSEGGEDATAEDPETAPESEDDSASTDELEAAVWAMVSEGDLSGAYWAARSLEAQGRELPAPSHLLMAAQGARWLSPNSDAYAEDLFEIASSREIPDGNDVQKLLGLAAALQASVIKPETNLAAWLIPPESCRRLERTVAPIREFKDFGIPARPEDIDAQDGIAGLRKSIAEASADASEWLEAYHAHKYPPATAVFRNLRKDGVAREMLTPVVENDQARREWAKAIAEDLRQETSAVDAINKVHQNIAVGGSSSKQSPIVSHARSWLVGKIQEAAGKAIHWHSLVERENKSVAGGNEWLMKQVAALRDGIGDSSRDAFAELDELRSDSGDAAVSAAAGCVAMSLTRLLEYLRLPIPESAAAPDVPAAVEAMDAIAADRADRLETAMGRRLIWTPAARLGDDCLPAPGGLAELGRLILENRRSPISLGDALKRRAEDHQDYRFYDVMSVHLSENCRADLKTARAKARKGSEDSLADTAARARDDLHHAVRDGILEFDALDWESSNSIIGRFISDDGAVELNKDANVDDFQTAHEEIETVQHLLGDMRDKKRAELSAEWNRLLDSTRERADIDEYAMQTWETKFSQADSQSEIRVMEVCATRLGNYLDSDERLLPADRYDSAPSGAFEEYVGFLEERARGSGGLNALINA